MDDFNKKRIEFLELIKPLFDQDFHNSNSKSNFLEQWKEITKVNNFCKLKFSYKYHEYDVDEEDDGEIHEDFQFTKNYDYIDCTRKNNPDCLSGNLCFCFGQGANGTQLGYIHTNSRNMVISHDDDIYLSEDIDDEILDQLKRSSISFFDFINILKPEVTNTTLMSKDKHSKYLQIERDNLSIRYSSNITSDDKYDYGDKVFQTMETANEFYFSFIEKYAKENTLKLSSCSDDVKFDVEKLIYKYS